MHSRGQHRGSVRQNEGGGSARRDGDGGAGNRHRLRRLRKRRSESLLEIEKELRKKKFAAAKRRKNAAHGASRGEKWEIDKPQRGERRVLTHRSEEHTSEL